MPTFSAIFQQTLVDEDMPLPTLPSSYLTNPATLDLSDPNLRLFDATVYLVPAKTGYRAETGKAKYSERHIPGANYMDLLNDFSDTTTGLGFSLPPPEALQTAFRHAGINNDSRVVFYSGGHPMWATRAWWLAHYAGHANIAVLDGGLDRWRGEEGAVTKSSSDYPPGDFTINPNPAAFVDGDAVAAAMGDSAICTLNALSPAVYEGTGDMHYGRRGHIPGSINLFYDELLQDGSFKSVDVLRGILGRRGLPEAERIIAYCGGGISATIDAFACLLAGYTHVAVYDGSMSEWVKDESRPLITGGDA
jgi:thiosulfate/3-mercaptopyruvate sulfurtransferase